MALVKINAIMVVSMMHINVVYERNIGKFNGDLVSF